MGCLKEEYNTYKEAISAINAIARREKQAFKTYKCLECGNFHITSMKKNKLSKKPKEKYKKQFIENKANQDAIKFPNISKINPALNQRSIETTGPLISLEQALALKRIIKNE